ncbi:MAG: hypothetical protein M1812_002827 [Candelaria pacifica]|nr:MAG: hypothetical protein M1812_002827 [Candelaria pacifica]
MGYTELPAEIREKILGYLLVSPGHIVDPSSDITCGGQRVLAPAVLRASRLTYKEGVHLLYHRNTFHFTDPLALMTWLRLGPRSLYRNTTISHIIVHLALPQSEEDEDEDEAIAMNLTMNNLIYREWAATLKCLPVVAPELETLVLWFKANVMTEPLFEDVGKWADVILAAGIRKLQGLEIWGILPDGFDDELMAFLKPMLESN